ncbi:kynurenine/alpha-aminoadipate aminotransferase, mitochondrial-like [Leptopilina heterotoma]|uniref:kynurenine/alpha-aminoadipate aminotransferase, mitochondrial-like n=1 Tax=Leptopilina heterotoma TaxID=63436 RepID=UPI001CAA2E64|nr:kynurenine/alpha-aminoadipate aminotransferase, mitochondrial-like [Leptopilina heterotoma]
MIKGKEKFKLDYTEFKTEVAKQRRSAATRELTKIAYSAPHSVISLAEGMPNEETFPFTEITVKLKDGVKFTLEGEELGAALQYIPSQGYPPLLQILRDFQRKAHAPPLWESRDIVIVAGGQDGLSKSLEAIIGYGDPILVQDPFYPGAEVVIAPHDVELIAIRQDDQGIDPDFLRETLREREASGKKMPKMMYINATGANPTGSVLPLERRKEIYRIACDYNFLILDDDPYHFMYFTDEAPKSFLSLDTEGRVIRVDSFSKILSSGLRIGVITAAAPLVASVELHMQSSHLHAPTLSQVLLYQLLKIWGYEKMMEHFSNIRSIYKERREMMVSLAEKHLAGLAEFDRPSAGFFLWIKVHGVTDTWKMVMQRGVTHGVLLAPGAAFMADPSKPCNAIRASFAKATYNEMNLALERLATLIKNELSENQLILNGNT